MTTACVPTRRVCSPLPALVLAAAHAAPGCGSVLPVSDASTSSAVPRTKTDLPVTPRRGMDLLFMIDDSPSMADKQANLAANLPAFINVLSALPGGLPDLHIGVVTSDLGTSAAADATPGNAIGTLGMGGCSGAGKDGALQTFGAPVTGAFLSDASDGGAGRARNYTGDLSAVFAQMVHAGAGGCGFEQQLQAVRRALDPGNAANQGFLRPNALLGVVLVTDEDDCSLAHASLLGGDVTALGPLQSFRCTRFGVLCDQNGATTDAMNTPSAKGNCHPNDASQYLTTVGDYASFLKGVKTDPWQVVVTGIMGTTEPFTVELRAPAGQTTMIPSLAHSCTYIGADGMAEVADPPIRIRSLLDQFAQRSSQVTVCQQDLSLALQGFAALLGRALNDPCIHASLADADATAPGIQGDCRVAVVADPAAPSASDPVLPRCTPENATASNAPCWHLAMDPMTCTAFDHLALQIEGRATLPATAHVVASCATAAP